MSYKKSIVKKVVKNEKWDYQLVLLEKQDGEKFAIRDYRMQVMHAKDQMAEFANCTQIEDLKTSFGVIRQFSNQHYSDKTGVTYVSQDAKTVQKGEKTPTPDPITNEQRLLVAGMCLIYEEVRGESTVDIHYFYDKLTKIAKEL